MSSSVPPGLVPPAAVPPAVGRAVRVLAGDDAGIAAAVRALQDGGLVGLPTETVYGLAADAEQPAAVARIYAAKGRPAGHPLIVHVAGAEVLDQWAVEIPGHARAIVERLWPGPLTVVLRRSGRAGDHVTGGQDTVALRSPDHPVAHEVLRGFGGGIAAPSANRFGRVSPTTAGHVVSELAGVLDAARDLVLDAGSCRVGLESTIVDCTGDVPRILRPGAIDHLVLSEAAGVAVPPFVASRRDQGHEAAPRVSGTLDAHYAPEALVVLTDADGVSAAVNGEDGPYGLIAMQEVPTPHGVVRLLEPASAEEYGSGLYHALRTADDLLLRTVVAVPPAQQSGGHGIRAAILDRLTRAAFRAPEH